MRIAVIGGGPGGLYFAYLWKRRHPDASVDLFEQNAAGATWGFGVVFSEQALEFLRADDPETVDAIAPRMESWNNITLNLRGESVEIDGVGFSSIGRLALLSILQQRVRPRGVTPRYDTPIQSVDQLDRLRPDRRGRRPELAGAPQFRGRFRHLAVLFRQQVRLVRHHQALRDAVADLCRDRARRLQRASLPLFARHEHVPGRMRSRDLASLRLCRQGRRAIQAICEQVFAATLDGHPLVSNKSVWRNFPWIWNERWSFRNMVLIGDALHSAHFSIGSGTRLAIEDAIALAKALEAEAIFRRRSPATRPSASRS